MPTHTNAAADSRACASQLSGLGYFLLAVIGAASTVTAFLVLLYGTCASAVYGVVSIAASSARIEQQRRQRPDYLQHPHEQ